MTASVTRALLPALAEYYVRLSENPDQSVADFGFSREKIHFQVVLESDGSFHALEDIRETSERGKVIPVPLVVPDGGGRSGTSIKPFFCRDNTGYALGRDDKGKTDRAERKFEAFRALHLEMRDLVEDDPDYVALCHFLEAWNPSEAEKLPNWDSAVGLNVVFRVRGHERFVHQGKQVTDAWRRRVQNEASSGDLARGISLVSGETEEIARLHPLLSGVRGTNTTGAAIVSFNLDAFESYGKTQSYNSPVGVVDAFRYTTALNRLLADSSRRVMIGDATVLFWAGRDSGGEAEELFSMIFGEAVPQEGAAESGRMVDRIREFLEAARQGRIADVVDQPDVPFYIVGLSPNASRIYIRFWLPGTVGQFAERLARHTAELEVEGAREDVPPVMIRGILDETVPPKNGRADRDRISPHLAGAVACSILLGLEYPAALLGAVVRRIRVEGFVTRDRNASGFRADWRTAEYRRAAILKAYLIRNCKKEVPVGLDKDHPDEAYHMGRLFAALEKTQEDATEGKLNRTIKDSYFGAASATPAGIFPRLLRLYQHHIDKIENRGWRINREKLIGEICGHINRFPLHQALEDQALFYLAYYHQRQELFTSKKKDEEEATDE